VEIDEGTVKLIATNILISQVDYTEFLSVVEMTDNFFYDEDRFYQMSNDERDELYRRVDDMIGRAQITVTFQELKSDS
jgi:hypothetical protein